MSSNLASLAAVFLFAMIGGFGVLVLEHQDAEKARINQEVHPYAVLAR